MLQVKNLTVVHKKDLTTLVEGLSFVLAPGDRAAVIGEEGNGKSTVLKLLYDPALVEDYAEWTGEVMDRGLRKGYLAQELPREQLEQTVYGFCQGAPAFEESDPKELERAARQVGLSAELFYDWRPMSTLSGGERVKLRLALLLLENPDVLLLDEPTRNFSPLSAPVIRRVLVDFPGCIISVSHDRLYLSEVCDRVLELTAEGLKQVSFSGR